MIIVQKPEQIGDSKIALTMGFFDGVHLGHKSLLIQTIERAKQLNLSSGILTFWPHPRLVLNKDPDKLRFLTTLNEKTKILAKLGFDFFIIQEFKLSVSEMDPERYIEFLVESYNVRHFIVGKDHQFGKGAKGDVELLKQLSSKYNYSLDVIEVLKTNQVDISSTKIREALKTGDLPKANEMLGYPYLLTGIIEKGNQLGRQIGFPTANIRPNDPLKLIPRQGVYSVLVAVNGRIEKGMLNIGFKPTINQSNQQTIEVHIFEFDEDIYNQKVEVLFVEKLRDEKKFPDIEHLTNQLGVDKIKAQGTLNSLKLSDYENYFLTLPDSKK